MNYTFADKHVTYAKTGYSETKLKSLRRTGALIEGVHFYKLSKQNLRYNLELLKHAAIHGLDSVGHKLAIKTFQASLSYASRKVAA